MSDTTLIITATAAISAYFILTFFFRRVAEVERLHALSLAKQLLVGDDTPDEIKSFLSKEDVISSKGIAPWIIVVVLPFLGIASLFSREDDAILYAADDAGIVVRDKFYGFLDSSAKSAILRSPLACLIVAIELLVLLIPIGLAHLVMHNAQSGVRSAFAYLFLKLDDFQENGFSGHLGRS